MDYSLPITPYNSFCLKYSKTTRKCFAWAKIEVKNQKQSSVNLSNKEANRNNQKGCTQKIKISKKYSFEIKFFEFIFA